MVGVKAVFKLIYLEEQVALKNCSLLVKFLLEEFTRVQLMYWFENRREMRRVNIVIIVSSIYDCNVIILLYDISEVSKKRV